MANQPKTPHRSVRLNDDIWDALRDIGEQTGLSVSELIRLALTDFIMKSR
jgi:predicted DNA-binding ribbon-helix-helix protein|tara:strand:- start:100 stop:249 length:150 start_codon:yes stop_codon:yes gene_type:complete